MSQKKMREERGTQGQRPRERKSVGSGPGGGYYHVQEWSKVDEVDEDG